VIFWMFQMFEFVFGGFFHQIAGKTSHAGPIGIN